MRWGAYQLFHFYYPRGKKADSKFYGGDSKVSTYCLEE